MRFWRIRAPPSESDYDDTFVNGSLVHPTGLPGIKCDACRETWAGSRILPVELPAALRKRKQLRDGRPIPADDHLALQAEVRDALQAEGHVLARLWPGDDFQPGYLSIPSRPVADFLWSSIGSVVVSDRVRERLTAAGATGARFCTVEIKKIGNRKPSLPAPIPRSGEPEDLISEAKAVKALEGVGPFFELVVTAESGVPRGVRTISTCTKCHREELDQKHRELKMSDGMWKGEDIFFLNTTLYIVVTDAIRKLLTQAHATNVTFEPI